MQKETRGDSERSKKTSSKTVVGDIFRTMAYNENQVENFSTILGWITTNKDTISSVINGKCVGNSSSKKNNFTLGGKIVSVGSLDAKSLESILPSLKSQEADESAIASETDSWDEKRASERLGKFEGLMKTLMADLCTAESIATGVPSWQISEYDQPTWNSKVIQTNDASSSADVKTIMQELWKKKKTVHVLMRLSRQIYNFRDVLSLLIPAIQYGGKFLLTISLSSTQDASCVLPAAYLIDAVNKSKIRSTPIDLLLVDDSDGQVVTALSKNAATAQMFRWGCMDDLCNLRAQIVSGVVRPSRSWSIHFIVDSSADIQSAVDSIATETWCSGTRVNLRARSLLFVHQPVYKTVVESLEKKISSLRISQDSTQRSIDFITRTLPASIDLGKLLAQGVKVFPKSADLSGPTIIYDIGTSTDLIANCTAGLGHVLCLIPYRSNAELVSLANNHGSYTQSQIYATNSDFIKKAAANIVGVEIRVNSSGKYNGEEGLANINNWVFLQPVVATHPKTTPPSSQEKQNLLQTGKDEFSIGLLGAEKSVKPWSTVGPCERYRIGERVLLSTMKNELSSIGESDKVRYLIDLMKITGQPFNNGDDNDSESFTILRTKPVGIVGIVLVNPEKMSPSTLILPILSATMKGNAAIVISVSSSPSFPQSIVEACNSSFPVGLVNFISSSSVTNSLSKLSHDGKVSLVWLIHARSGEGVGKVDEEVSRVDQIPFKPFTTVIVDHEDFIRPSSSSFVPCAAKLLQSSKIIHW